LISLDKISGGDSEAAKVIFGGSFKRIIVNEDDGPDIAKVWYKSGKDGKCELWRYNFATD
jgi:hypothetical protein